MDVSGIVVQPVGEGNFEASVQFLMDWVSDGKAEALRYLADHAEPEGTSLVAMRGQEVVGYVAILWESNFAGFRDRGIPLVVPGHLGQDEGGCGDERARRYQP